MINLVNKFKEQVSGLKSDNKKLLFVAVSSLLLLYADFVFVIKSQVADIKLTAPKVAKLKKDIAVLNKDLSQLRDFERRQTVDKNKKGEEKPKELITEDKVLLLLQEVTDLAGKNKVKVVQINTLKEAKVKEETMAGQKFLPLTIKLDVNCDYHSLVGFINGLENAGYVIELQDMRIARDVRNYLRQNANLTLKTYVRK